MLTKTDASQLQGHHSESSIEAVRERPNHETRPYVVRDLSWEFARFLDTATATDSGGNTSEFSAPETVVAP